MWHARLKRGIEKRSDGPHVRVMRMCRVQPHTSHHTGRAQTRGCTQADAHRRMHRKSTHARRHKHTQAHCVNTIRRQHNATHPLLKISHLPSNTPPSPHPSNSPMAHPCQHINMALFSCKKSTVCCRRGEVVATSKKKPQELFFLKKNYFFFSFLCNHVLMTYHTLSHHRTVRFPTPLYFLKGLCICKRFTEPNLEKHSKVRI